MKNPIKWFFKPSVRMTNEEPDTSLAYNLQQLEERITVLEEKYEGALIDIKRLEEENIETTNCLYENANSIDAVDARIDILAEHCGITEDV
jgi:septal ring factor EnvC (AmiA/AmiB activator)